MKIVVKIVMKLFPDDKIRIIFSAMGLNKITLQPQEMGILYTKKLHKDDVIFKNFLKDLRTVAPVTWLSEDYYSRT